jgi:hypothetical protein
MLMRYLHLAMLVAPVAAGFFRSTPPETANSNDMARQLGDFAWDLGPEDGYPIIGFDNSTEESEVVFKYNFTGNLDDRKFLDVKLYQNDCVTAADASLAFVNTTNGDELDVDLDIIQETISKSVHYQDLNGTAAIIGFCLRVDYNYVDGDGNTEIINFHETNVTINVDLTANFTLAGIALGRTMSDGDAVAADLDYGVEAYICREDGSEVMEPGPLGRGQAWEFCVRKDQNDTTDVFVADVLSMTISQPGGQASGTASIVNGVSDPLTEKSCTDGICSMKTQLSSKFFERIVPDTIPDEVPEVASPPANSGGGGGTLIEDSPIEGGVSLGNGNMVATGGDPGNGCENPPELYNVANSGDGTYTGGNAVLIEIHFDDYPSESGWTIKSSSGDYITGLCTGFFSTKDVVVANTVYVTEGTYVFEMTDNYGDGLCCSYGEGGFNITVNDVMVENDITFDFTYNVQLSFEVSDPVRRLESVDGGVARRLQEEIPVLQVEGVALLAFGRRRLRAPIRGLIAGDDVEAFIAAQHQQINDIGTVVAGSAHRMLTDQSGFNLEQRLRDDFPSDSDSQDIGSTDSGGSPAMAVAVIVLIILTGGCGFCFFFFTRRARKQGKEEDVVKHHSSAASVDTDLSERSVWSSSTGTQECPSYRKRIV